MTPSDLTDARLWEITRGDGHPASEEDLARILIETREALRRSLKRCKVCDDWTCDACIRDRAVLPSRETT